MASNDEFTPSERERLRASLQLIGDQAGAATRGVTTETVDHAPRRRRGAAALVGASALVVAGIAGLWAISGREAVPSRVAAPGVDGPWFVLDLPDAMAGDITGGHADTCCLTRTWLTDDVAGPIFTVYNVVGLVDTFRDVLARGEETLAIPDAQGDEFGLWLVADAADPPDPERPDWRGNAAVRRSPEPSNDSVYTSWGMTPVELVTAIEGYEATGSPACACAPSWKPVPSEPVSGYSFDQQDVTLSASTMRLWRTPMPSFSAGTAGSIEPTAVDRWPARLIDRSTLVWNVGTDWFRLEQIPSARIDEVIAALRTVAFDGRRPTAVPTSTTPAPPPQPQVQDTGTLRPEWTVDGLWYSLDLADAVGAQPTASQAAVADGMSGRAWVAPDSSKALVMWRFESDPGFSTLIGQPAEAVGGVDRLRFYATPDDPVEAAGAGDEMRWERADGAIWEFKSFGLSPLDLTNAVLGFAETCLGAEVCDLPGLAEITTDDPGTTTTRQEIQLGESTLTLTRSMGSPMLSSMFGDVDTWRSAAPTAVGALPGVLVDGTRVVWEANRWRFSLDGIPPDRLDEVIAALRPVGEVVWGTEKAAPPATPEAPSPGWTRLVDSPLSPRTGSTAVWTGSEIIVVGGSTFKCPPAADCAFAGEVFSDGAAYDPATGVWRSIKAAPVPFMNVPAVSAEGKVYFLVAADRYGYETTVERPSMLAYDPLANDWTSVLDARADLGDSIVAGPVGIVVYHRSAEQPGRDYSFDTTTGVWGPLPDDGVGPSYDRTYVALDDGWLAFGSPIIDPAPSEPPIVEYARFSVGSGSWSAPQTTGRTGQQVWRVGDVVMLNPHFSTGSGGLLDLPSGEWGDLPLPVDGPADAAGVVTANGAVYDRWSGTIADLGGARFVEIDRLDDRASASFTTAGRDLFVFGGELWETGTDGRLLGDAWIWRPPA